MDAVEEKDLESTTLLSDLLAPLLPDSEFVIEDVEVAEGDDPAQAAVEQPEPLQVAAGKSTRNLPSLAMCTQGLPALAWSSLCFDRLLVVAVDAAAMKVAPWVKFVDASVVTIIGDTDARSVGASAAAERQLAVTPPGSPSARSVAGTAPEWGGEGVGAAAAAPRGRWYRGHPLAREGEWEPFVCYTVRVHVILQVPSAVSTVVPARSIDGSRSIDRSTGGSELETGEAVVASGRWTIVLHDAHTTGAGAGGGRWRLAIAPPAGSTSHGSTSPLRTTAPALAVATLSPSRRSLSRSTRSSSRSPRS